MSLASNGLDNPYVGPRAFRADEPFFGRERDTNQLLNLVIAERIVLMYSPSGAGKTSLIQAALVPRLLKMKFQVLPIARVNLDLRSAVSESVRPNRYMLSTLLSLDETLPEAQRTPAIHLAQLNLHDYLSQRPKQTNTRDIEVMIFDQFEEILTLNPADREAKQEFFRQVGEALESPKRWALFSMREDFVAALDPYVLSVPSRFGNTFRLDLLDQESAYQAIQQPARRLGVDFEEGAALKLLDDLRRVRRRLRVDSLARPQRARRELGSSIAGALKRHGQRP